jgi:tripartite-type tricarboxylate transporter receptor subunit TctC
MWPTGPVDVTLPFSQGNAVSLLADIQARVFTAHNNQDMNVLYVPGRGGLNAWAALDASVSNGSVLTGVELPGLLLRNMQPFSGLELDAMVLCHVSAYSPLALWVPSDSVFRTLDDLIAEAGKQPRKLQIAGPGTYSPAQVAALRFDRLAGIQTLYMPCMGELEAAAATADPAIRAFWADALAYPAFGGQYRPLAVAGEERSPVFPDVPTFRERHYDLVEGSFRGYVVSARTPPLLRQAIFQTFEDIRSDPQFTAAAAALGFSIPAVDEAGFTLLLDELGREYREKAENLDIVRP